MFTSYGNLHDFLTPSASKIGFDLHIDAAIMKTTGSRKLSIVIIWF
ncbi:hypothetical protein T01_2381 [Trichinella spiralis]|uniref:Uncharacterized protein n=1 Tax=Trichinella spiralis TaxID=6334 RepID=A0A0V1AMS2_TRISP|nr:hypothetical protein T01_2381 [Trichinella spiralis]